MLASWLANGQIGPWWCQATLLQLVSLNGKPECCKAMKIDMMVET
jgi:hypothetical protein